MPLSIVFNSPEWVTPANIFTTSTAYSTISGTTNKIFLTTPPISRIGFEASGYGGGFSRFFSSFKVTLSALTSAGAVGDAAKLQACLTQNGSSCYPGAAIYDSNALTTTASVVTFGTDGYGDLWQSTLGTSTPDYTAQAHVGGNLTCDNSSTVINANSIFPFFMEQGSNILINGLNYKLVDSTNNASRLTLTTACPTGTYAYVTYNFGVLIWKKTASSDTISINSANVYSGMGAWGQQAPDGGIKTCSDNTVTPPNGNPGRICGSGGGAYANSYFIDSVTSLARLIEGNFYFTGAPETGSYYNLDPTEKYGITVAPYGQAVTGGLIRVKYFGSFNELNTNGFVWSASTGSQIAGIANCSGTSPYTAMQPCEEITSATGSLTMGSLIAAFTTNPAYAPAFDPAIFSSMNVHDTDGDGNIDVVAGFGQYRPAWQIIFNPRATSNSEGGDWNGIAGNHGCVGGGSKGCVMAAMPDYARKNCRWCGTKDVQFGGPGWLRVSSYIELAGGLSGGPWTIQAIDGTADGSSNVLDGTTSLRDCPANPYDAQTAVGSKACSQMTFSAEPVYTAGPNPTGPLSTVQPGDYFAPWDNRPGTGHLIDSGNINLSRVLTKTASATAGAFVLVFQRDITQETRLPFGWTKTYGNQSLSLPLVYMYCNSLTNPGNTVDNFWHNWPWVTDPHGMTDVIGDVQGSKGHSAANTRGDIVQAGMAYGYGGASTPATPGIAGSNPYNAGFTSRFAKGRAYDAILSGPATYQGLQVNFGGSHASTQSWSFQSHPGPYGSSLVAANPNFDGMYMDGRPSFGGNSSGNTGGSNGGAVMPQQPATKMSGDLWKFESNQMVMELPYSKFYPIQGYTGRVPILNVSGPNCSIGPTAADNYKFGIVAVAGECYLGSTVGQVYVNAPHVNPEFAGNYLAYQAGTMTDHRDINIGTVSAVQNTHTQTIGDTTEHVFGSSTPQLNGTNSRTLIRVGERVNNPFMSPVMTPDNKFAILEHHLPPGGMPQSIWLAKMPPRCVGGVTSPCLDNDGVDRTNFINVPVIVPLRANSVAWVRFGTSENNTHQQTGDAAYLNCTGRQEYCTASTVGAWNAANPFWMETSEAISMTPVDVSIASATIRVPGFPSHVIYYQIVYRDKTSNALTVMPLAVAATP